MSWFRLSLHLCFLLLSLVSNSAVLIRIFGLFSALHCTSLALVLFTSGDDLKRVPSVYLIYSVVLL